MSVAMLEVTTKPDSFPWTFVSNLDGLGPREGTETDRPARCVCQAQARQTISPVARDDVTWTGNSGGTSPTEARTHLHLIEVWKVVFSSFPKDTRSVAAGRIRTQELSVQTCDSYTDEPSS
ncbi:hypothetical protein Bbelb_287060 [Branchiostoma belcheri]|nr:hypothetical protein Bbelb_287060 [Branchiostoma belcheri]